MTSSKDRGIVGWDQLAQASAGPPFIRARSSSELHLPVGDGGPAAAAALSLNLPTFISLGGEVAVKHAL